MRIADYLLLAARLLLAAVFLVAGSTKLVDPVGFRKGLRGFGLPRGLMRPTLILVPALELAVAVALIPSSLAWYGAWGALALLAAFLIALCTAMALGRRPDCHCFGQLHPAPAGWRTLVRNGLLIACAGWLVTRGQRQSEPELWAWLANLDSAERRVALVAAFVLAFLFLRVIVRSRPASVSAQSQLPAVVNDEESEEHPEVTERFVPPGQAPASAAMEESAPAIAGPLDIGLPVGTPAPEFELPRLTGERRSLQSLRAGGCDVLLIFSSPFCKPCAALASNLVRWKQEMRGLPNIVLISRGTPEENLAKLKEFPTSQVLLQREFEVAHAYDCSTTPTAVLIGADGLIQSELVSGAPAIKQLLSSHVKNRSPQPEDTKAAQRASAFRS